MHLPPGLTIADHQRAVVVVPGANVGDTGTRHTRREGAGNDRHRSEVGIEGVDLAISRVGAVKTRTIIGSGRIRGDVVDLGKLVRHIDGHFLLHLTGSDDENTLFTG